MHPRIRPGGDSVDIVGEPKAYKKKDIISRTKNFGVVLKVTHMRRRRD